MYKLLINTSQPKQHIISPQRILKIQSQAQPCKVFKMDEKECLLHTCETQGRMLLYRMMGQQKKMIGEMGHEIYPQDLQVKTQVLVVGSLCKSQYIQLSEHLQLRRENIELVQVVQDPSRSMIYFKSALFSQEFYNMLLHDHHLFVLYIQEVNLVSIPYHPQLDKELLFIINGIDYHKSQNHMEQLCQQKFIQLPMCYPCLLKLQYSISGIPNTVSSIPELSQLPTPCTTCQQLYNPASLICSHCKSAEDIWICMVCSQVGCGRYKNADAFKHFVSSGHVITINLETQRIWNYQSDSFCHRLLPLHKQQSTLRFPDYSAKKANQLYQEAVESAFWQYCSLVSEELQRQRVFYQKQKGRQEENFERQSISLEKSLLEIQKQLECKSIQVKKLMKKNKKLAKRYHQLKEKCTDDRQMLANYDQIINQGTSECTQDEIDRLSPRVQQKLKILQNLETEIQHTLAKLTE